MNCEGHQLAYIYRAPLGEEWAVGLTFALRGRCANHNDSPHWHFEGKQLRPDGAEACCVRDDCLKPIRGQGMDVRKAMEAGI